MKSILLGLGLIMAINANASECIFGDYASAYQTQTDSSGEPVFLIQEKISLGNPNRLNGLNDLDKKIILEYITNDYAYGDAITADEAVAELNDADGYIVYFYNYETYAEYVQVGFYPGDNNYGAIYKIERDQNRTLSTAALIHDGDIEGCTEFKK